MDEAIALTVGLLGYVAGLVAGLVLHEAGHAVAAWWLGLHPRLVTIGHGKILLRRRCGQAWLVVRAVPIYGSSARLPEPHGRRGAQAAVIAAGPLVNLVLLGIAWLLLEARFATGSIEASEAILGFAVAQAVHTAGTLVPRTFKVKGDARRHRTDGRKLIEILRGRDPDAFRDNYAALLRPALDEGMAMPMPSPDAPEILYQLTRRDLRRDAWAVEDAVQVLFRLLAEERMNEPERMIVRRKLNLAPP